MPTLDELAGLYDKAKTYRSCCLYDLNINVHLTELIHLTSYAIWASEKRFFDAALFNFEGGLRCWCEKSLDYYYRALPVRSVK